MEKEEKLWKITSEKVVWDKRMRIVECEAVLPNGEKIDYIVEDAIGAVATLISPKRGFILLTRQYRFPLNKWIYDLPGGGIGRDETPQEAAKRECEEEVGYKLKNIQLLAKYFSNPARTRWPMHIFFCSNFERCNEITTEPSENVRNEIKSVKEIEKMINRGKIVDPSLMLGFYIAKSKGFLD